MVDIRTREQVRNFPREQPVDCTMWVEFTIVEETYRHYRIRYREVVSEKVLGRISEAGIESRADKKKGSG